VKTRLLVLVARIGWLAQHEFFTFVFLRLRFVSIRQTVDNVALVSITQVEFIMTDSFKFFVILAIAIFVPASTTFAQPKIGAVGDSLLDEHFDQTSFGVSLGYSQNGLELLVNSGKVNAGPTGSWGGTRNTGYQYNWALAGSTTGSLISSGQHTNLADQVVTESIPYAVMVVGSNDLFPTPPTGMYSSAYEAIYEGVATQSQIDAIASQAIADVVTAAQTLKDSGVNLIVAKPPDYGISPFAKHYYPDPVKRERVDDVIQYWTEQAVVQLINNVQVPVVDIYQLTKDIWGDNGSENATFELGGVFLNLNGTGGVDFDDVLMGNSFSPTSDTVDAFVHDGIHPNNTIGGVFANLFLTAFNDEYGASFDLFTEQEILSNAGPTIGGMYTSDTFSSSLGGKTYSDYVISAVPEPGTVGILATGMVLCVLGRRRFRRCR
jgi:hypothetical protein